MNTVCYLWGIPNHYQAMKNKVAILARVSTSSQSNDRQITELTEHVTAQGLEIVGTFTEVISGTKKNEERPVLLAILKQARSGKINKVCVLEVTRLGRDTLEVLSTLEALHALKVSVLVKNLGIETLTPEGKPNAVSQLIVTIVADLGRMEKELLIERINSGLAEAKRKGTKLGRKEGYKKDLLKEHSKVVKLLNDGYSVRKTATLANVGVSTVQRVKKEMETAPK